jgi:hypothetical protein
MALLTGFGNRRVTDTTAALESKPARRQYHIVPAVT